MVEVPHVSRAHGLMQTRDKLTGFRAGVCRSPRTHTAAGLPVSSPETAPSVEVEAAEAAPFLIIRINSSILIVAVAGPG